MFLFGLIKSTLYGDGALICSYPFDFISRASLNNLCR